MLLVVIEPIDGQSALIVKKQIWGNKMDNKEAGKLTVAALRNA